jgi:lysozyme family protein
MKVFIIILLSILSITSSCFGAEFEKYFPHLIKSEGTLFTVTQYDRGGATKFGITLRTYNIWCNSEISMFARNCDKDMNGRLNANDLRLTTLDDVRPIYKLMYWDLVKADRIENQAIAELVADMAINCGTGYRNQHIKAIQKFIGVKSDGRIGPKTIEALNNTEPSKLYKYIFKYRKSFYQRLGHGNQRKFVRGWLNRINNLKKIHQNEKLIEFFAGNYDGVYPVLYPWLYALSGHNNGKTKFLCCFARKGGTNHFT